MVNWRILLTAALLTANIATQDEAVFRSEARYVEVSVQVLAEGKPVLGLKPEEFRVYDEGQLQPISRVSFDEKELDIVLLVDFSESVEPIQESLRTHAAAAMLFLKWRDRLSLVVFNHSAYAVADPTWDRMEILNRLAALPRPKGGTEANQTIFSTTKYLQERAGPEAGRAIVMLTDNCAHAAIEDDVVRHQLWETDTTLTLVNFPQVTPCRQSPPADVRRFAKATGGEVVSPRGKYLPLAEAFQRLRQRYSILYPAPGGEPGSVRKVRVELTDEAKKRYKDLTVRARMGYVVGVTGSEARQKLQPASQR